MLANQASAGLITISGTAILDPVRSDGATPLPGGMLSFVAVDTLGDGFRTTLSDGATIAVNSFLDGSDDYIVATNPTDSVFGQSLVPGAAALDNGVHGIGIGDAIGIYFFEDVPLASEGGMVTLSEGSGYGFQTDPTWEVFSSGSKNFQRPAGDQFLQASSSAVSFKVAGGANVPEPSSLVLAGMVVLCACRRKR